jgi:hypothetical protein
MIKINKNGSGNIYGAVYKLFEILQFFAKAPVRKCHFFCHFSSFIVPYVQAGSARGILRENHKTSFFVILGVQKVGPLGPKIVDTTI